MPHEAPETEIIATWKVSCDGGEGALGHPRVWLVIPQNKGYVECGYATNVICMKLRLAPANRAASGRAHRPTHRMGHLSTFTTVVRS